MPDSLKSERLTRELSSSFCAFPGRGIRKDLFGKNIVGFVTCSGLFSLTAFGLVERTADPWHEKPVCVSSWPAWLPFSVQSVLKSPGREALFASDQRKENKASLWEILSGNIKKNESG